MALPPYILQSDGFVWFWEQNLEDQKLSQLSNENHDTRGLPETDYICVCTALASFEGSMSDHPGLKGLTIREGDVIYVLRMADCPNGYWMVSTGLEILAQSLGRPVFYCQVAVADSVIVLRFFPCPGDCRKQSPGMITRVSK
eukprot:sb/3474188/